MRYFKNIICLLIAVLIMLSATVCVSAGTTDEYEYYVYDGKACLTRYIGEEKIVTVPNEIDGYPVSILLGTFDENSTIEKVTISEGIETIGSRTFFLCTNLKEVILADTVKILGDYAFAHSSIRSIDLKQTRRVNTGCFMNCNNLTVVESSSSPQGEEDVALYLEQYAFAFSNLRIIKSKYIPSYQPQTFTRYCIFADNIMWSTAYKISWLVPVMDKFLEQSTIQRLGIMLLVVVLLFCAIVLVIRLARFILWIFGKDKISNYHKYSKQVFEEINLKKSVNDIVHYKKISFRRDVFFKISGILLVIIVTLAYLMLLLLLQAYIRTGIKNAILHAVVVTLPSLALTVVIIGIACKLGTFIVSHKKTADKPQTRIRRVSHGGKKSD